MSDFLKDKSSTRDSRSNNIFSKLNNYIKNELENNPTLKSLITENKFLFLSVIIVFIIFFFILLLVPIKSDSLGLLGDSFNVLTSLFTGLAFAGLVASMLLQQQELTETKKALIQQKDEFIKMNELQQEQQFKNDVKRDVDFLLSTIDQIKILLSSNIVDNKDHIFKNYHCVISDLEIITDLMMIYFKTYYERYNNKELSAYADEEMIKALSYKRLQDTLLHVIFLYALIKDDERVPLKTIKRSIVVSLEAIGNPEIQKVIYLIDNTKNPTSSSFYENEIMANYSNYSFLNCIYHKYEKFVVKKDDS